MTPRSEACPCIGTWRPASPHTAQQPPPRPPPTAQACREAHGGTPLTRADFRAVYEAEVAAGKFWGVEHDLRVLRGDGLAVAGAAPFTAVFDYVFASDSLEVVGVQPPLDEARSAMLANGETWLPNECQDLQHSV